MTDPELTDQLRRQLAAQARQAPSGDGLAEQIIARATAEQNVVPLHRAPRRAPWGRALAAAAAVAVIAGAGLAIAQYDRTPDRPDAAATTLVTPPVSTAVPTPSTSAPLKTQSTPDPSTQATGSRLVKVPTLSGVRVVDITFTGTQDGWGLASADCLTSAGRCTALLRTTDGARVWQSRPNTPFQVPGVQDCAAPCVRNIRFATDDVGYAYGPSALFMTTDGAKSWQRLDGGADAIETLDGNVIRVSGLDVSTADIGSTDFTDVDLPGAQGAGDDVTLARSGEHAYLLSTASSGGGSRLWTSSNDGRTWRNRGEPCAQSGGRVDSRLLTTAADGAVVILCRERATGRQFVAVSTDDGARFRAGSPELGTDDYRALGAASADIVVVSGADTFRTVDGGRRFSRLAANSGSSPGDATYLGFSSDSDAHAISADGRIIFTTRDAGRTWAAVRFG